MAGSSRISFSFWLCGAVIHIFLLISPTYGYIEGLYCGKDDCYEVLGVTRDASKGEITKAYRKLARQWHPDMHKKQKDKDEAEQMFLKIAAAYEVLKDEDQRRDYDDMLDNPDHYYRHYFKYYHRRMAPKVDIRIVIAVTISVISIVQYLGAWNNYKTAINYLASTPKYRNQAFDIARSQGLLDAKRKKDRTKTKEEIREEEEAILKKVIEDKMDIRGGYSKPTILNILWIQLFLLPYWILCYIGWYAKWIWKFTICRQEYTDTEKCYIIRKKLKLSEGQWEMIEEAEKEKFFKEELWIQENFTAWEKRQEEERKMKLAENTQHKKYRRYMKKGGPGQLSFGPD